MKIKLSISIFLLFILTSSFMISEKKMKEKSCTVYVKWESTKKPAKNIKVVGFDDKWVMSSSGTQVGYTDVNGMVVLKWNSHRNLYTIIVDGKGQEGDYSDGGTYTFFIK